MSLIIVNEDSLDVSRSSLQLSPILSVYTVDRIGTFCVCLCMSIRGLGDRGVGVLRRLLWEQGCGPHPDWWVGLFVCSQVQVIKVSGVPLEKGMKRDEY